MIWGERWLLGLLILMEFLTFTFIFVNHFWFIISHIDGYTLNFKQKTTNIHFMVSKCKSPAIDIHLMIISNCFTFIWSQVSLSVRFLSSWIGCPRKIVGLRMRIFHGIPIKMIQWNLSLIFFLICTFLFIEQQWQLTRNTYWLCSRLIRKLIDLHYWNASPKGWV
jgi:hypothetical protein